MPKLLARIVENSVERFRLYQTTYSGGAYFDEEIGGPYATKEEAMKVAKTLQGRWFVTVTGIVAESKLTAEERAKRLTSPVAA
jgi:hypothetical protein